ncbi:MAG: DUF3742 family protein [Rhodocyclaceae bacterium]|uniref:DUF3742 family protein n=1 Tax=Denitromonas sp. TaxID=2734609 RepID=UPI003A8B2E05|nr:DUF3742 family protein [Rhodocyclaceae bacterium]
MNTKTRLGNAERFGRWLGGLWRGFMRQERGVARWLVARGMPAVGAMALLWTAKLAVLGLLLYVAFWLAMLLVFAAVAAWVAAQTSPDREDEHSLTTLDALRKKPGYDPNLYNDTSHEMYEED